MAKLSPEQRAHLEWLGYVQPTGLVVSPMALATHGAIVHRNDRESQRKLLAVVPDETLEEGASTGPHLPVFRTFTQKVLGWTWKEKFYVGTPDAPLPDELKLRLEDYEET
ncbi:hypothetical protein OAF85_01270, partial [Planctomycetota bacterium]|nr:hypothetical protein [Planctomycetota bacterium]